MADSLRIVLIEPDPERARLIISGEGDDDEEDGED